MPKNKVLCGNPECRHPFDDEDGTEPAKDRVPCPQCEGVGRLIQVGLDEAIATPHSSLGYDARPAGAGKKHRFLWGVVEKLEWHHDDGLMTRVSRVFNKRENRYTEKITDHETGEVRKEVEYPLDEKFGHGDDNKNPRLHD